MRHTKRSLEGYLLMDNRASGGKLEEFPVVTCAHCQQQIMLNPGRTRERAECSKCDKYLCDGCDLVMRQSGECRNYQRQLDAVEKAAFREINRHSTVDPRIILT